MLLLLADYYSEKGEQLDKAESYAKKIRFAFGDGQKTGRRYRRAVETAERVAEGLGVERIGPGEYPEKRTMRRR